MYMQLYNIDLTTTVLEYFRKIINYGSSPPRPTHSQSLYTTLYNIIILKILKLFSKTAEINEIDKFRGKGK